MWKSFVRGTEWKQIVDLASPRFFDVLPSRSLRRSARALMKRWRDHEGFAALRSRRAETLASADLLLRVEPASEGTPLAPQPMAELVVTLYFHQLFADDEAILDLRPSRFGGAAGEPTWDPKPLWTAWDPDFVAALREVYAGFYEDDDRRFDAGLRTLGLEAARDSFLQHFGEGDQRAVTFRVHDFTSSFHDVFVRCRDAGVALHADFVPLGLYLATMYDHLDRLNVPVDVRRAYHRARGPAA